MGSGVENEKSKKHNWQLNSEENNPCFKEQKMSLKCIDENNYDLEMCQLHFENYNNCKKFWNAVKRNRRINGIKPFLPPFEERIKIKEKFKESGNI